MRPRLAATAGRFAHSFTTMLWALHTDLRRGRSVSAFDADRNRYAFGAAALAGGLVGVHALVGAAEQRLERSAVRRVHRVADADRQGHRHARRRLEWNAAHRLLQFAGALDGLRRVAVLQHDDELVAALAGAEVVGAHRAANRAGDELQRAVACLVPEPVVDLLEAIDVDDQQRPLGAITVGLGHLFLDVIQQRT